MGFDIGGFRDRLFGRALEAGFSDCEIYYVNGSNFRIKVFEAEISEFKNAGYTGLSFRGTFGGKVGYAFTERIGEDVIGFLIENARENALIIGEEEDDELFGGDCEYPKVELYNEGLNNITVEEKIEAALTMERTAKGADPRIKAVNHCVLGNGSNSVYISNTKGLDVTERSNGAYAYVITAAEEGGQVKEGAGDWQGCFWDGFDPADAGVRSAAEAVSYLGAVSAESGKYSVILNNMAASGLLDAFSCVFSADNVQKGFSLLQGKIGEKTASEIVTVRDDALLPYGAGSAGFDSEGVPTANKTVIENGVLKTFLHNQKTAKKDGVKSTGNGFKPSFKASVGVACTNFYIAPGGNSFGDLMGQMGSGLLITDLSGLHAGANTTSGDFSIKADGFLVENGIKKHPVEQITVAGNFFGLLNGIAAVGDDLVFSIIAGGNVGSPSILIDELSVAGL